MAQAAWNRRLANAQYISQTFAWPDSATDNARGPCIRRDVCQGESQMPTVTVRAVLRTVLSLPLSWAPLVITFALPVAAQEAPAESAPLQEVVVTGIRRGIEDAIKLKENSGSIVEAISAEDIGKLPDTSIAESISRLPGLTSQRAEGRASAISLRGTDPGFTTTLLNGREQVSTGDNRSIEFDQYPSELLSSVVIYKTPDAQLIGQGLAGTIDMRTTRPLEFGKRALAFNVRGERNSDSGLGADSTDKGYRGSFSYIDQFMDNRLGVTFGVARLNSPLATEGFGTYEPWSANGAGVFTTNGMKVRTDMGENTRDGAMAALEFRPVESFTSILDLYYTKSHEKDNARSIEVNVGGYPAPCCDGDFADAAGCRIAADVHLDAARVVLLVALGVVEIEDAGEGVHRAELERRHRAV